MDTLYIVTDTTKLGRFNGQISSSTPNKFTVLIDSKINTTPYKEETTGDLLNKARMMGTKLTNGRLKTEVSFISLADAAKAICISNNWEAYTFIQTQKGLINIKEYFDEIKSEEMGTNDKVEEAKAEDTLEILDDVNEETKGHTENAELSAEEQAFLTILRAKNKNKQVELGEDTLQKLESLIKSVVKQTDTKQVEDFDWGYAIPKVETSQIVGSITHTDIDKALDTNKKAVIVEGVPGTGKTKLIQEYVDKKITDGLTKPENTCMITFHQEYTYNEFIGGEVFENGKFAYKDGIFTRMCKQAYLNKDESFYLIIDEFSRGNTEAILGEVMTAICNRGRKITLAKGRALVVPENLYILASMNITDNSTKNIDLATYQRFQHLRMEPQWTAEYIDKLLEKCEEPEPVKGILTKIFKEMECINEAIGQDTGLGLDYLIGTRDITIEHMTVKSLVLAIKTGLIPTIKRMESLSYGGAKEEIHVGLKNIYDILGIEYNED